VTGSDAEFGLWQCQVCGFVYDEREGWPDEDIAPGTRWADIPDDWCCPDCGAAKADFEMQQIVRR
jgi:rubredoxin-NAD+ reductase